MPLVATLKQPQLLSSHDRIFNIDLSKFRRERIKNE